MRRRATPAGTPTPWPGTGTRSSSRRPSSRGSRTPSSTGWRPSCRRVDARVSAPEPTRTRVVVAEDEAIIRLDLKELLEEEGYEVVGETGRGDEAVELVKALRP